MNDRLRRHIQQYDLPLHQTVVITGGNSGLGFEFARHVARIGWHIVLAVRSLERGEAARQKILEESPDVPIEVWHLNLAESKSVDAFCAKLIGSGLDVDVFYENAGVYRIPFSTTDLGFEMTHGVNFVANYILYRKLRDYFRRLPHPVKFVLTTSVTAHLEHFKEENLYGKPRYKKYPFYGKSKVAVNQMFKHLVDDCAGTNIVPLLVHPGCAYTPLIAKAYAGKRFQIAVQRSFRLLTHSAEKAALCALYLMQNSIISPCFCGPRGPFHFSGYPKIYHLYQGNLKDYQATIKRLEEVLVEKGAL